MWFDSCLAGLSVWLTYSLQVVFGYLTTRCICAFIHKPRTRVRMWGCFLLLTIAAWLALWIPVHASDLGHLAFRSASLPPTAHLQVALPLNTLWAAYVTKLASTAWRLYFLLLLVSLLPLILKSLQLKSILRRAQPPSPQLQLLFQKLCLQLRIAHCELALLSRLRSPATCYWLRSHVLLPTDLVPQLDSDQLADVLRHELIHVKQHDTCGIGWQRSDAGWFSFTPWCGWPTDTCDGSGSWPAIMQSWRKAQKRACVMPNALPAWLDGLR